MGIKQNAEKRIAEIEKSIELRKAGLKNYLQKFVVESSSENFRASYFSGDILEGVITEHKSLHELQNKLSEIKSLLK